MEASQNALYVAAEKSRTEAIEIFKTPSERGVQFAVPQLAVRVHGELQLFDDPEVLDYPWDLPPYMARPSQEEIQLFKSADRVAEAGVIDTEKGKMTVTFLPDLTRDLALSYTPEHWTEAKLAAWLCRNVREIYITQSSLMVFVSAFVSELLKIEGVDLAHANRQKFLLRTILDGKIRNLRQDAVTTAYQQLLFTEGVKDRAAVGGDFNFVFHPDGYAPSRDYARANEFVKHYYPRVGDFDSGEEAECAHWLDRAAQRGEIEFWVRNLVRKPTCSFFLPTTKIGFFPDFVCRLPDGRTLVVEYKSDRDWDSAKPDRDIGELWEELSGGKCLFVMVKNKRWEWIEAKVRPENDGIGRTNLELGRRTAILMSKPMPGIDKNIEVCGGVARIAGTRIPVWVLVQARRLRMNDAEILRNYPSLTAKDLEQAWEYAKTHQAEIDEDVRSNENA
jgi:type III restriction enzyme